MTAETPDGLIMGLQHKTHPVHGVQFHPESIASQQGHALLANFLQLAGMSPRRRNAPVGARRRLIGHDMPAIELKLLMQKVASGASLAEDEIVRRLRDHDVGRRQRPCRWARS